MESQEICANCPNRDCNKAYKPFYGISSRNASIAFVAEGPRKRDQQHAADDHSAQIVVNFETYRQQGHSLREVLVCGSTGTKVDRIPAWFFDKLGVDLNLDGTVDGGPYYTNSKKCAGVAADDEKNATASTRCQQYLRPELLHVLPQVVVTVGLPATTAVFDVHHADQTISSLSDVILEPQGIRGLCVIPSYHWSHVNQYSSQMVSQVESVASKKEYWQQLAELIYDNLNDRDVEAVRRRFEEFDPEKESHPMKNIAISSMIKAVGLFTPYHQLKES